MRIFKEFKFEAAHSLPNVPEGHKCRRLHGHSYRVRVVLDGPVDPRMGWVCDFSEIKRIVQPLIDRLDHQHLNTIEGLSNSTAELIAVWFWDRLKPDLPMLEEIQVFETETSGCVYRGEP
jgi:6-pyruvoyltetrahydropterin/6-carboxytetrahydropterin synthase